MLRKRAFKNIEIIRSSLQVNIKQMTNDFFYCRYHKKTKNKILKSVWKERKLSKISTKENKSQNNKYVQQSSYVNPEHY